MLKKLDYLRIKKELIKSEKPFFFFHDDPDGLCSFLLLYRFVNKGKGQVVKTDPRISVDSVEKVKSFGADKVFITDIAVVDQEFIDKVGIPVIWIDHHQPLDRKNVLYFNPRIEGNDNHPATYLCYNVVEQDLWIAAIGAIGDYFIPNYMHEFAEKYPKLLEDGDITHPNKILYGTELGKLIRMFSFALKGKSQDYGKCIKILTRVENPEEITEGTTSRGRFIAKRFEYINKLYLKLKKEAMKKATKNKILLYTYEEDTMSFTGDLANELLHECPDKVIIIARNKSGRYKCSMRSVKYLLPEILEKAMLGIDAHGGGHEHACGANVAEKDFPEFLERIEKELT